jgi:hypothetical protein
MNTLRGRLILSHTLALLLVAPLIGVALVYLLETHVLLDEVSDSLAGEANLIADVLRNRPNIWRDSHQAAGFVARIDAHTDRRLFLLSVADYSSPKSAHGRHRPRSFGSSGRQPVQ